MTTGKVQTKKERIIAYIILLVISLVFMSVFSIWESPFYKDWYGCDASFFSMAGRGILTKGWVPYVDFFDLKGPYFFFIEALSQLIHTDRLGVFILEIPFFYASMILIYEICRLFVSLYKTIAVTAITLFLYIATLWGGNTLEEFMLPLSLLVIFLTLKYSGIDFDFTKLPNFVPLISGICFGIILFSKVTVGAPIAGVVVTVCISCIIKKDFKAVFKYLGFCLIGVLISIAPVIIYFTYNNALERMLYCVFEFAAKRSLDIEEFFTKDWELRSLGCYFTFLTAIFHPKKIKRPIWILLISSSIITYFLMHLGGVFIYYFTTAFPVFILGFVIFLDIYDPLILFKNVKQFVCLAVLVTLIYNYSAESFDSIRTAIHKSEATWYEDDTLSARELAKLIPTWERDQVFSFSIDMTWFEANQMLPCYKYPINLQYFIFLDPRIESDIISYLNTTPPKWLIIGDGFPDEIPSLFTVVSSKYECISSNDSGNLYMLKD